MTDLLVFKEMYSAAWATGLGRIKHKISVGILSFFIRLVKIYRALANGTV
jgi:hypothetical protein